MNDCLFCKIVARQIPASIIYEDVDVIAFLDIKPVRPGHLLVLPKVHCQGLHDLPKTLIQPFFERVQFLSSHLRTALSAEGINLHQNEGAAAGQVIKHLHVHLIPRRSDDGLEHWHGTPYASDEERDQVVALLSTYFTQL